MPLVTVLMPVYNAEKFLGEAIDSILNQTFSDFEFLIVDDASTDSSLSIINSYNDHRIKLVCNEENMGISATLNKGIALSSTELIARMDADDISYPERLQKQYAYFIEHPDCALLSCWTRIIKEDKQPFHTEEFRSRYYYYNMTFDCWMYHPTVMYKRTAVLNAGGYQSPYAEDFDLFWHMMRKYKVDNLEQVLLDYRITSQSLHQVTKKAEYDHALDQQVIRNIKYYAGDDFYISYEEVQCLRYDFEPILRLNSLAAIVRVFKKLEIISLGILNTPNLNLDPSGVQEAWYYKRCYMKVHLLKRFGFLKKLMLRSLLIFFR